MTSPEQQQQRGEANQDPGLHINIDPFAIPEMRTLVYSPDVRILIGHGMRQYDVSSDIVRMTLIRREDAASTAFITLANKKGRYNSANIKPMDRIYIEMKRVRWVPVFTGYLDTVPFRQIYPGVVTLKATCTLKRLLHTWWNPALPDSLALFNQQGIMAATAGDGENLVRDGGMGSMLRQILIRVGNWRRDQIHIENFPVRFYDFLISNWHLNQGANQAAVHRFRRLLLGDDISGGAGMYASYNSGAGSPGAYGLGQEFYVAEIIAAADELGLGPVTRDLSTAQQIAQAAAAGQEGMLNQNREAWEKMNEVAAEMRTTVMNNDGAVLGVACAMAESGLRNLANLAVPDSLNFPNDGLGPDHDSVGLFQQRNFDEWGTVAQRMNPRQAARMFFSKLAQIEGWRNMDPGLAIYKVQRGGSPQYYSGFIPEAQKMVSAYREANQGLTTTITSAPGVGGAVSAVAGAAGVDVGNVAAQAITTVTQSGMDPNAIRERFGKPNPDSEGAVQTALMQQGKPYLWGAAGPDAFDCSGLFYYSFRAIGINIGRTTYNQLANGIPVPAAGIRRGDLVFPTPDHVMMYLEPGVFLHSPQSGDVVRVVAMPIDLNNVAGIRRFAENGGPDPTAPRGYPPAMGPGMSPLTGGISGSGTGGSHSEPIARNLFSYMFDPGMFVSPVAELWGASGGLKDFIDSQPLIKMIRAICAASLRKFQSAPNGDFMAYYPDFFGLDGKKAVLRLEDIELKNCSIDFSDDNLTTHVYVAGDVTMMGYEPGILQWLDSSGVATVEQEWLFQRLRNIGLGDHEAIDGQTLMRHFGVRPFKMTAPMAGSHELEFLLACQIFMEKWAQQYETKVSFTFMPELLPGMRIQLGDHNLQVYVSEVMHDIDFERGFSTSATVMAPSNPRAGTLMERLGNTDIGPDLSPGNLIKEFLP